MLNNQIRYFTTLLLLASLSFSIGCSGARISGSTERQYLHQYTLVKPVINNQLIYRDEYIIIQFKIDESAVKFQMQNISETPVSIVWEHVALGLNNRVFPVRNNSTLYLTEYEKPLPVIIPPLGYIRDMVIPKDYIRQTKDAWIEKDLFPANDYGSAARKGLIMRYIGSEIQLTLPVKIGDVVQDYSFTFRVKNIKSVPENMLPPVKQRPTPPIPAHVVSQGSQSLLPIVLAGGILAVAIYVFSREKATPINF